MRHLSLYPNVDHSTSGLSCIRTILVKTVLKEKTLNAASVFSIRRFVVVT
jgi:hypothetical protein